MAKSLCLPFVAAVLVFLSQGMAARAEFIDLHNLGTGILLNASAPGITVNFNTGSANPLVSTANRFGVDSGGTNVPDLLDGGNGFAESIAFLFQQPNLVLDSVLISEFEGDDSGAILIKGHPSVSLANGLNPLNLSISQSSANFISWQGPNSPNAGRGFSVDGFNVHVVPEPSTLTLLGLGGIGLLMGRRSRSS
jgi:hypothetical protein